MKSQLHNLAKRCSFTFKSMLMTVIAISLAMNIQAQDFVPVTNITGVPFLLNYPVTKILTGTVVPEDATNQEIMWSIKTAGAGATITDGNKLNVTGSGMVIITATITDGVAQGTDYTQDFEIMVTNNITETTRYPELWFVQITEEGEPNVEYHYIFTSHMFFYQILIDTLREVLGEQAALLDDVVISELPTGYWAGDFEIGTIDWWTIDWWNVGAVIANPDLFPQTAGNITSYQDNSSIKVLASESASISYVYVDGELYPVIVGERIWDEVRIFKITVTKSSTVGINDISAENAAKIVGYYNILGQKLDKAPESGLYIIVYDNGTAKKVIKVNVSQF